MVKIIFLSHSHIDREIASCISRMIERVTLAQIQVWASTDERGERGLVVGDNWLEKVRLKLEECQAVIPLITPNSIHRPWIYFESGFGAGMGSVDIIPLCIYVDSTGKIPSALATYQVFHMSSLDQCNVFLRKLLARFNVALDEEMAHIVVEPAFNEITQLAKEKFEINHIFKLNIEVDSNREIHEITVGPESTIQDVLDDVFYYLPNTIPAHSYLDTWVLYNYDLQRHLIVRGFAARALARNVFKHHASWVVKFLERPCDLAEIQDSFREEYADYKRGS